MVPSRGPFLDVRGLGGTACYLSSGWLRLAELAAPFFSDPPPRPFERPRSPFAEHPHAAFRSILGGSVWPNWRWLLQA